MLDHISLGVSDLARSQHFYDATLRPLGLSRIVNFQNRDYGRAGCRAVTGHAHLLSGAKSGCGQRIPPAGAR